MTDPQTQIRMQLLVKDAGLAVYAYHNAKTDGFVLLPLEDFDTPQFKRFVEDAPKQGFKMVAVLALMKKTTPDGQPLIEDEAVPGASDEDVQKARQLFRDSLIEKGILKLDDKVN